MKNDAIPPLASFSGPWLYSRSQSLDFIVVDRLAAGPEVEGDDKYLYR